MTARPPSNAAPEDAILSLLAARGTGATICPSEAARVLSPDKWRARMDEIRTAAARLAAAGVLVVTQKGVVVDPEAARGPIRLGRR
ncbi:MAG: DUF3253 domain-containing protein [Pseudomonadota bacterium]